MRVTETYGRFDSPAVSGVRPGSTSTNGPQAGAADDAGAGAATGEKVTVSAHARELADKADAAKVSRLREAIDGGALKVDRHAIARRIVDGG